MPQHDRCRDREHVETSRMTAEHAFFPRAMSLAVHELRTPVTVVAGYLRMLIREQGGPLTEKQKKMLEEAERSCSRISALVAEMSELGKLEGRELALSQQEVDLAALVAELASGMHEGEDRGVRLEVRGTRPVMVTGDRTRLTAALKALMHSALRERGEPGVIVVETSEVRDTTPPWAVVAIADASLVGELAAHARQTPPPFDEWRGGLGMALPVARRVIETLGGALWSPVKTQDSHAGGNPVDAAPGVSSRAACALRIPLRT
jgi:signal transduction histidine kinase